MFNRKTNICSRLGVLPDRPDSKSILGLAIGSLGNDVIHGLRHPSIENTNGWYIWSGEFKDNADFFLLFAYYT